MITSTWNRYLQYLFAEEALAQLGQPGAFALQGAHELLLLVAQQDVVGLSDEGLVVVEVLAAGPGGSSSASQVQHDGTIRPPVRAGRRRPRPL